MRGEIGLEQLWLGDVVLVAGTSVFSRLARMIEGTFFRSLHDGGASRSTAPEVQLVDEAPFGALKLSGPAHVTGCEESTLSRTESGPGPSVTYVLSAVAPDDELVCTLQVSYPTDFEVECQPIALACLRSAQVL